MKNSIYFTSILGLIFLVIRFIGIFLDLSYNNLFLTIGLGILLLIALPLYVIDRIRYKQQKEAILNHYHKKKSPKKNKENKKSRPTSYPSFRDQKSGLTWGGGNIHASTAKRGSKKGFLKH